MTITLNTGSVTASTISAHGNFAIGASSPWISNTNFSPYIQTQPTHIISVKSSAGQPVVTLNQDGTVTWAAGVEVNEAAEMFSQMLTLSVESKASITARVKRDIRDQVFEEIIEISKLSGSLTTDELTYMLESSKIIEKLKNV